MIYDYEASVLKHINKACPEIKVATYAKEKTMFNSLAATVQTPALLFYRVPSEWSFAASFRVNDGSSSGRFVPVNQTYIARIYFTQTSDILAMSNTLRFYLEDNPYVFVKFMCGPIKVALRLLYIKVDEDSDVTDKKGPLRYIEFSWSSQLFLNDYTMSKWGLVEQVRIYVNPDGSTTLKESNLIKTIK